MSAPTILTPAIQAAIVAELEKGNYRSVAAASAGISERTFRYWMEWGKEGKEPYRAFLEAVAHAEATIESKLLTQIMTARPGVPGVSGADPWTNIAWVMERRWPKRWSGRVRLSVHEEVGDVFRRLQKDPELARRVADALSEDADGESPGSASH